MDALLTNWKELLVGWNVAYAENPRVILSVFEGDPVMAVCYLNLDGTQHDWIRYLKNENGPGILHV
jgi:hypothetical protein